MSVEVIVERLSDTVLVELTSEELVVVEQSTSDTTEIIQNQIVANMTQGQFDFFFSNKTTDELTEGDTNLYFSDSRAVTAIQNDSSWHATNWDTAFGWGDHAGMYDLLGTASAVVVLHESTYDHALIATALQSFTEVDPVFSAWASANDHHANWDTAYSWGNHASAGYALASSLSISNWNTAYSWGNHAGLYDLLGAASSAVSGHESTYDHDLIATALQTETDPLSLHKDQTIPQAVTGGSPIMEGIQFGITPTTTNVAEGLLRWNSTDRTLDLGMGTGGVVTQQIGQELFIMGVNKTAAILTEAQVVYVNGRQGTRPKFELAKGDAEATSSVVGVVTENIAINAEGFVTTFGYVRGIKTNYTGTGVWGTAWAEGDRLWVSKTTAGQLTNIEPAAPNHSDLVATVSVVHGTQGSIFVNIYQHRTLEELSDVDGTPLTTTGQIPVWNDTTKYFDFDKNINDYKTYSGFENRTDSTISIDGSGVFTLAPKVTSFNVYVNGNGKLVITGTQTVTVTTDQTITFIYVDSAGVLQKTNAPWDLDSGINAPCSIVFKDATNYAITDERHGYERNKAWHKWAHNNIGAMFHYGLTGVFNSTTLSVTQGEIADEDIDFDTTETKTTCSLWYRNATNGMRLIRGSSTPYRAVSGALKYDNGSGTLANVDNNKYTTMWFYCSNDAAEPIYAVIGQNNDTSVTTARNAAKPIINLSTAEWKLIYRVIFRNAGGTPTYIESADFRAVQTGVPSSVGLPTAHASLTGRELDNQHPASAISYDNTTSGIVATDVQAAIDKLVHTLSKSFVITNPTSGKEYALWKCPQALTITAIHAVQVGGTNLIGILTECDADGLNPVAVNSSDITVLATNVDLTSLSNPSIDLGDYIGWKTTSISGAVSKLIVTFDYEVS